MLELSWWVSYLCSQKCLFQKNFRSKKFFGWKKMLPPKKFWFKKMLVQRYIFVQEFFRHKIRLSKIFLPKQITIFTVVSTTTQPPPTNENFLMSSRYITNKRFGIKTSHKVQQFWQGLFKFGKPVPAPPLQNKSHPCSKTKWTLKKFPSWTLNPTSQGGWGGGWRKLFPYPNELLIWAYPENLVDIGLMV